MYLYIDDNSAQIMDAAHLWGKDTIETVASLKEAHGKGCRGCMHRPRGRSIEPHFGDSDGRGGRMPPEGGWAQ